MANVVLTLLVLLLLGAGIVILQIYLSKKENKWPGLVLPIISLCISLIAVLNITAYTETGVLTSVDENGLVIQEEVVLEALNTTRPMQDASATIFTIAIVFLLYNIPTIVLLAIYFGCRGKRRRRKALDKMQAQDLE